MSLRSAWTKLTSYAQPLKGLQNVSKALQPRTLGPSDGLLTSHPEVAEKGRPNGSPVQRNSRDSSVAITRELDNGGPKPKIHVKDTAAGPPSRNEIQKDVSSVAHEAKSGLEATDGPNASGQTDSLPTGAKKKKRRKKKNPDPVGQSTQQEKPQQTKSIVKGKLLNADASIDNLLNSISDPRIEFLGASAVEQEKTQNSKVTIDALLESIPDSGVGASKSSLDGQAIKLQSQAPIPDQGEEVYGDEPRVNIVNTSSAWQHAHKTGSRAYHILRLDNCGSTMIKSDFDRIFSNYHARRVGWNFKIVPGRSNLRLQRTNRYYLYFDSSEAAKYHLTHFNELLKSEKIHGRAHTVTLPPPAAAQTFLESKPHGLDLDSDKLQGSAASVRKYWVPKLYLVDPLKMPLDGVIPSVLYKAEGAPGRTVLVSLCANTNWKMLQIWLRYSLIEKYGFGRWLVSGGDKNGCGLERIPIVGPNTPEPQQGGKWVIRFRDGCSSEAERLVRDWDGQWVSILGKWGRLRAEILW